MNDERITFEGGEECWTLEKKGEDLKIVSETRRVDGLCRACLREDLCNPLRPVST